MNLVTIVGIIFGVLAPIGIAVAGMLYAWQTKTEIEKLKKENERLKMELLTARGSHGYTEPRDISADKHLMKLALAYKGAAEVRIIGINSLGVIHQAREDIKELLEANKSVKFLLLNPRSGEFIQRIKDVECIYKGGYENSESHKRRLLAEWNATIMGLRNIAENTKSKSLLKVKVRNEKPTYAFSAIISDKEEECIALINEYPPEGRGTRGKQFLCRKSVPSEKYTYKQYMTMYETSWDNAETISIEDERWIM
jgi:hypothetical protein